jgi:acetyl esterase/lipase
MKKIVFLSSFTLLILGSCSTKKIENVSYFKKSNPDIVQPTLTIYTPRNHKKTNNKVLLFVHGGNWNSGDKKMYWFLGRNFARKGITTVIVGYNLSPKNDYDVMAKEVAQAVQWTKLNIEKYKGNPNEIFITGHSAGGHLAALVGINPRYLNGNPIIKGIILNDAAGLDMKTYLEKYPPSPENNYDITWTKNPEEWKNASPIYFIDAKSPPILVYLGSKTYESIKVGNAAFVSKLHEFQPKVEPIILNKKHVPMMTQYIKPWSRRYREIIEFMNLNK